MNSRAEIENTTLSSSSHCSPQKMSDSYREFRIHFLHFFGQHPTHFFLGFSLQSQRSAHGASLFFFSCTMLGFTASYSGFPPLSLL